MALIGISPGLAADWAQLIIVVIGGAWGMGRIISKVAADEHARRTLSLVKPLFEPITKSLSRQDDVLDRVVKHQEHQNSKLATHDRQLMTVITLVSSCPVLKDNPHIKEFLHKPEEGC